MTTLLLIGVAAFCSTMAGGLLALRLRDQLHLILGFSAGAVIGVAFFDLLPEALELAEPYFDAALMLSVTAIGFLTYLVIDRVVLLHAHHHEHAPEIKRGWFSAGAISFHSFLDGIGIGFAFQVSPAVGLIVATAVLAHNFSDGINTVGMVVKNNGGRNRAFRWLMADACAPMLGILVSMFFVIPQAQLSLLLALFAGFYLYLGASDLIPESQHAHPVLWTTVSTVLGASALYVIIQLAGI